MYTNKQNKCTTTYVIIKGQTTISKFVLLTLFNEVTFCLISSYSHMSHLL